MRYNCDCEGWIDYVTVGYQTVGGGIASCGMILYVSEKKEYTCLSSNTRQTRDISMRQTVYDMIEIKNNDSNPRQSNTAQHVKHEITYSLSLIVYYQQMALSSLYQSLSCAPFAWRVWGVATVTCRQANPLRKPLIDCHASVYRFHLYFHFRYSVRW